MIRTMPFGVLKWELRIEAAGEAEDVEDGKVESQLKVGLKEVQPKMPPEKNYLDAQEVSKSLVNG